MRNLQLYSEIPQYYIGTLGSILQEGWPPLTSELQKRDNSLLKEDRENCLLLSIQALDDDKPEIKEN